MMPLYYPHFAAPSDCQKSGLRPAIAVLVLVLQACSFGLGLSLGLILLVLLPTLLCPTRRCVT